MDTPLTDKGKELITEAGARSEAGKPLFNHLWLEDQEKKFNMSCSESKLMR